MNLEQFENIDYSIRNECIICNTPVDDPIISLPNLPVTGVFTDHVLKKKMGLVDQNFHVCEKCGHGQISNVLDQKILYGSTYATRGSTSTAKIAVDVFLNFVQDNTKFNIYKSIIDIGCNDLYMIQSIAHLSRILYGIDPALKNIPEDSLADWDINTIHSFIEDVDLSRFKGNMGLVLSSHTFEHIPDPKKVISNLLDNADDGTLFAFQFPGLESLVRDYRFDQIFHQHLNYFSLQSVNYMLNDLGAELIAHDVNDSHWGSLMILFRKKRKDEKNIHLFKQLDYLYVINNYIYFKNNMDMIAEYLLNTEGKIYGYGASQMLPLIDYHLGEAFEKVISILDEDPDKVGMSYLNSLVEIVSDSFDPVDSTVLITAISSMDNVRKILPKLIDRNVKRIISPFNLI